MPGLVPGIHVFASLRQGRRGWPGQARPWRKQRLIVSRMTATPSAPSKISSAITPTRLAGCCRAV